MIFIYRDFNYTIGWEFYKDNEKFKNDIFIAPQVDVHCVWSENVKTKKRQLFIY